MFLPKIMAGSENVLNYIKKMKSVGVSNLVFGIVTIAFGIGAGVMMIVNGARLLAHKSDVLF